MRVTKAALFVLPLLWGSPALADSQCQDQPAPVKAYLQAHPEWVPVRQDDLGNYRNRVKTGLCPGIAIVDLAGDGRPYFGLALLRRQDEDRFEKVILLSPAGRTPAVRTLSKESKLGRGEWDGIGIIERGAPGTYFDYNAFSAGGTGNVRISHDVLFVTSLGPDYTEFYYLKGGRLTKGLANG